MLKFPEQYRITDNEKMQSNPGEDGAFELRPLNSRPVHVIASSSDGWEHVSVSAQYSPPTWDEMNAIKDLFWDDGDCVMQLHPPKEDYVNKHPNVLHLWRPLFGEIPRPPQYMV